MSVYFGCSHYALPTVVARYVCRCGRIHTLQGAVDVSRLPPGWHERSDTEEHEPECPECHEKTVERRKAGVR